MNNTADKTLKELIIGVFIFCVFVQIILFFIPKGMLTNSLGLWIGGILAVVMVLHMKHSLEDALDLGGEAAVSHSRKSFGIRLLIVVIVLGVTFYFDIGNVITTTVGVMGLKIAAYIQPLVHKGMEKLENSK